MQLEGTSEFRIFKAKDQTKDNEVIVVAFCVRSCKDCKLQML